MRIALEKKTIMATVVTTAMAPADDPYAVLGVRRTATDKEIAKAYRALALRYHPDRNPGSSTAEAHFKRVSAAYDTLRDAVKRAQFDSLGAGGPIHAPQPPFTAQPPPFRTGRTTTTTARAPAG